MNIAGTSFAVFPTHPILYATIAYILGIGAAYSHINIIALVYCFLAIVGIFTLILQQTKFEHAAFYKYCMLFFFAFLAGILLAQRQAISHLELREKLLVTKWQCTGIIASIEPVTNKPWSWRITCNTQKIITAAQEFACSKQVIIYTKVAPYCNPGDLVTIHDLYCQPATSAKYELYLLKEGIAASTFCNALRITIEEQKVQPWRTWLQDCKLAIIGQLRVSMSPKTFALWSSLFLGYKDAPKNSLKTVRQNFKYWGISHYLARSAMHSLIFIGLLMWILGKIPINFFIKQSATMVLLIGYFLLSWSGISFLRSFIIFGLYKLCVFTSLQIRPLYILLLTTIGVLIINPAQLWFIDFQLSFGLTCALAWYGELLNTQYNS